MAAVSTVFDYIKWVYYQNDTRMDSYFLLGGIGPLAVILVSYLYFCLSAGPRYMKDRKPYDLNTVLIVYNFSQVLISIYLVKEALEVGWWNDYKFVCQPVDYSDSPKTLRMLRGVHLYYLCKIVELLDTIFFVLRKKNNQITFLHLYHHTLMPLTVFIGARYFPGGHVTLLGLINSFIHVIMYAYYMLAAFGPKMQKYLWWKRYITILQILQFVVILTQNLLALTVPCQVPKSLLILLCMNAILFIYMFSSFYVKAYLKPKSSTKLDNRKLASPLNGDVVRSKAASNNVARSKSD